MTKEEAIEILNQTFINTDGHIKASNPKKLTALDIHQALTMAIQALSQPTIFSDVEVAASEHVCRAASKYILNVRDTPGWDWTTQDIADAFKAGVKWLAEQYKETIELAEDHAYLAGQENIREKMMEWLTKELDCLYELLPDASNENLTQEQLKHLGKYMQTEALIDKLNLM